MNELESSWDTAEPRSAWSAIPRAAVLVFLGYVFVKSLGAARPCTIFWAIDLGIHEAGHLLFRPFGEFLMIAGGTILQLLAPLATGIIFLRRGDRFAACFAAAWLGINLVEVAVYLGDARAQVLPLVTVGGGEAMHDWTYLLGRLRCLGQDEKIAGVVRGAGLLLHAGAVIAGGWVTLVMATNRRPPRD